MHFQWLQSVHTSIFIAILAGIGVAIAGELVANPLLSSLQVPGDVFPEVLLYLRIYLIGMPVILLYNFEAAIFRSTGDTKTPLVILTISGILNVLLNLFFVAVLQMTVNGVAIATVVSNAVSSALLFYGLVKTKELIHVEWKELRIDRKILGQIMRIGLPAGIQSAVFAAANIVIQSAINSLGTVVMAAFAAAVKIDAFAYMPVQDFGNAFSTFIAQNYGAKEKQRIQHGLKAAVCISAIFCIVISAFVFVFAKPLMMIFVDAGETHIIMEGVRYIEIGWLFLLYGLYRALGKPGMSVVLTIFSLGTRVVLAYILSAIPQIGVTGIWWSVPIGWALADIIGFLYYKNHKNFT